MSSYKKMTGWIEVIWDGRVVASEYFKCRDELNRMRGYLMTVCKGRLISNYQIIITIKSKA